jgi:hypothetical protein
LCRQRGENAASMEEENARRERDTEKQIEISERKDKQDLRHVGLEVPTSVVMKSSIL